MIVTESAKRGRAKDEKNRGRQAVLGRFWSGRIAGAPPADVEALDELCALSLEEEVAGSILGAAAVTGMVSDAGCPNGAVFSSRRTIYW